MATSKRSSANASESETKRAEVDECVAEYEVVLGGEMYVNADRLFKCAELKDYFKKHYKRSATEFIAKKDLQVVFVSKKNVEKGVLDEKEVYGSKSDVRLVKKDERIKCIIATAKESSYPIAPSVIKDKELTFFVDKAGTSYQVEIRGERTMNGIYFKAKDVGVVFENEWFVKTIQCPDTSYRESIDYVWFAMLKGEPRQSEAGTRRVQKEVFLTSKGLLKVCHASRALMCRQPYGEIYLIRLGDRLYKFGKSSNFKRRVKDHEAYFNGARYDDIEHVYSAKVDIDKLSAAETAVKKFLQASNCYRSARLK